MIIRDAKGVTAEVHLYDNNTGIDFVEDYLNAGALARDADGVYTVEDVYYIDDYATLILKIASTQSGVLRRFETMLELLWVLGSIIDILEGRDEDDSGL